MTVIGQAIGLVRQHGRAFVLVNVAYFSIVCCGMAYGACTPQLRDDYKDQVRQQAAASLPKVFAAYRDGHVAVAMGMTLLVNLLVGSMIAISLPSFIIPYSGLLVGGVRAFTWGFIFSPTFAVFNGAVAAYGLLVGLLLFLEGEGYVLAMLGSYIHGTSFLFPRRTGAISRWQGYKSGVKRSVLHYVLVAGVLGLAAVYEALMVIYLIPLVR